MLTMSQDETLFTVEETSRFLRCSMDSLRDPKWRRSVGLQAVRVGKSLRFVKSDLLRFLEKNREILEF